MKTKYLIKKILRKIYHFIGFMTIFMICLLPVKADTVYNISFPNLIDNSSFLGCGLTSCSQSYSSVATDLINYYNTSVNTTTYNNWYIRVNFLEQDSFSLTLNYFKSSDVTYSFSSDSLGFILDESCHHQVSISNSNTIDDTCVSGYNQSLISPNSYIYYDSNFTWLTALYSYNFSGFYTSSDSFPLNIGNSVPKIKDLFNYSSWSDYSGNYSGNMLTVNLNNYDYVLLSLKNYSQSNAFQSNLQIKGQIGITPIYNYGQTSKDSVTGVQIQDRCNNLYSDYTSYPLYILQSDLQNNVVYAVKSCSENSSFKFDTNVFDITYVTQENASDPIITINGQQYHTIPYNDLPSTATKNETDNYIPGESYNFVDSGIDSLNSALKQSGNWLSSIWSTITYFMQFIGLILSSLPPELHAILISAFTITIIIGLLKHFTG